MDIRRWDMNRLTNGEYAALRRAAGTADFDAEAWRAFYKVDFDSRNGEETRFTALCMSCLWRRTDEVTIKPMEECLRSICWENADGQYKLRENMAKRVEALLETNCSRDGFFQGKLLSLVKIIRTEGRFKPDFEQLAIDLYRWNSEDRSVQRRWLRTIYHRSNENDVNEEGNNNDA